MDRSTRKQMDAQERQFAELLRQPGNSVCADCGTRGPKWASWNIGVFLCIRCGGAHRAMGAHVSKVKALSLDVWTPEQMESIARIGNEAANRLYNPSNVPSPRPTCSDTDLEQYIRNKYERKTFMNASSLPPPTKYLDEHRALYAMGFTSQALNTAALDRASGNLQEAIDYLVTSNVSQYPRTSPPVQHLVTMGFTDIDANIRALEAANGSIERAVEILTDAPEWPPKHAAAPEWPPRAPAWPQPPQNAVQDLLGSLGSDPFAMPTQSASAQTLPMQTPTFDPHVFAPPPPIQYQTPSSQGFSPPFVPMQQPQVQPQPYLNPRYPHALATPPIVPQRIPGQPPSYDSVFGQPDPFSINPNKSNPNNPWG